MNYYPTIDIVAEPALMLQEIEGQTEKKYVAGEGEIEVPVKDFVENPDFIVDEKFNPIPKNLCRRCHKERKPYSVAEYLEYTKDCVYRYAHNSGYCEECAQKICSKPEPKEARAHVVEVYETNTFNFDGRSPGKITIFSDGVKEISY